MLIALNRTPTLPWQIFEKSLEASVEVLFFFCELLPCNAILQVIGNCWLCMCFDVCMVSNAIQQSGKEF